MARYFDADALYESTAEWEARALAKIEELNRIPLDEMDDDEKDEWRKWTATKKTSGENGRQSLTRGQHLSTMLQMHLLSMFPKGMSGSGLKSWVCLCVQNVAMRGEQNNSMK